MTRTTQVIFSAVSAVLTIAVIATDIELHSADSQISQLRGQVTQLHSRVIKESTVIRSQETSLAGSHRDLITCADLQSLLSDMNNSSDSNGDTIYWGASSVIGLPVHCVNN